MSAPIIDDVGVQPADGRPDRAIALVLLSRATLALMVVLAAWAVHLALSGASGSEALALPRTTVVLETGGIDHAGLLEDVVTGVRGAGGRLVELDVGHHVARRASVRMRVEMSGRGAGEVDRLVRSVASAGLEDVTPQGITPVVGGVIVDIAGAVWLRGPSTAPAAVDARSGLVVIGGVVERSRVGLRRLELLPDGSGMRIEVTGPIEDLSVLVAKLEQDYSSPADFRSFRFRSASGEDADLDIVLGLRSDSVSGDAAGVGMSG